ncbi:YfhO family protein [Anaeromyxobacter oryzae]|uniref:YfhO family protein n=1 Tax=Anaeromyxobacter oryzae TaxID=2918170 RepID=A0ABN6N4T7_9BACT|nr:YfhO family protein [Anaeromyxobacter oryzae]BDG06853.1 hypothetical protein AMOR_58490 [Anaeromyxobacter oryzae]
MNKLRLPAMRAGYPLAIACAVLAPLGVHWVVGRTLVCLDTQILYAPQRWMVDEALRAFRLPLWNPYMGAGVPFLADAIHGVLHPVSVLTAWLDTDRSADVLIGGYVACAGVGAALVARDMGATRPGAAAAAVVFGTSGYVLSMTGNLVFLAGAGSLPFAVAGLRRFAAAPGPVSFAFGVGGVAVLALSGDAQALMVSGVLALALAWEAAGARGGSRAAIAGFVGLLVAGIQLVPSAVHVERTVRAAGTWFRTPFVWALEPTRVAELVTPGLMSGPDPFVDRVFEALAGPGGWPVGTLPRPFSQSIFIGLVPIALAVVGVREGRRGRVLGSLALLLLWIALGPRLGAESVLRHVPLWRSFRYSEKLVAPLTLVVAVLAGLGLDAVAERRARGRWLCIAAAMLALVSVSALLLVASALPPDAASMANARILRGASHVSIASIALVGWVVLRDRLGVGGGRFALLGLVWASMAAASPIALRPGDVTSRLGVPGPSLDAPAPGPRLLVPYTHEPLSVDPGFDWSDQAGRVHAPIGYPAYHVRSRLDSMYVYNAMAPARLSRLNQALSVHWAEVARRYAVTHAAVARPITFQQQTLYALATSGAKRVALGPDGDELWAVPHRDWATFALDVHGVEDVQEAIFELAGGTDAVLVESRGQFAVAPGRVLSIQRGLESLRVEAEADAAATLVIADAWWPGWEATIDGSVVMVYPADVLVRAVRWPPGHHVLEMRYHPPEVATGILVSAVGIAALALGMAVLRRVSTARRTTPGT